MKTIQVPQSEKEIKLIRYALSFLYANGDEDNAEDLEDRDIVESDVKNTLDKYTILEEDKTTRPI
jgi:hypothetical protein